MLVTDLAYRDMEACAGGFVAWIARVWRKARRLPPETGPASIDRPVATPPLSPIPNVSILASEQTTESEHHFRWRRHPQLRSEPPELDSEDSRRAARSAAIQGLFLARGTRFDEARAAFAIAAADHTIDLTNLSGFWDLSRGGMLAAVGGYEDAGRFRDAASLAARIRTRYRPRTVSALPVVPARRVARSGS